MTKADWAGSSLLGEKEVARITAYLSASTEVSGTPYQLAANANRSFEGSRVEGTGFVLSPEQAQQLLEANPRNRDVLFEYLRGDDFTSRPDQTPAFWVINFHTWPLDRTSAPQGYVGPVAADYPECLAIVERDVKPQRMALPPTIAINITTSANWWRYRDVCPALHAALKQTQVKRVLFHAFTSKFVAFAFVKCGCVFAAPHNIFVLDGWEHFAALQCSFHIEWAYSYCSTLETRLRYTRSSIFETYPFPAELSRLAGIGMTYHQFRAETMLKRGEGLTTTYNRFHDPEETGVDILKLRQLHVEMDTLVAAAHGWAGVDLGHDFHQTKQGLRYTISEPARREILARLLKLNHERYAEEVRQGLHEKKKSRASKNKTKKTSSASEPSLFGGEE
jgi:hypothetical protein